jgi:hypothetical protein
VLWFEDESQLHLYGEDQEDVREHVYTPTATIIFPPFDAGVPMLMKDFNGVEIHGDCIGSGTSIEVFAATSVPTTGCDWEFDHETGFVEWLKIGTIDTTGEFEVHIPCSRSGTLTLPAKNIMLKLVLHGSASASPIIRAIKLEYWVNIKDYLRFNYAFGMPWDCLVDRCGNPMEGYSQGQMDADMRAAICKQTPVLLKDLDGLFYYVRVESASRRFENIARNSSGVNVQDMAWSIVLVQVCPTSLCDASTSEPVVMDEEP